METSKRNLKSLEGLCEDSRRLREDKGVQVRKMKRADRASEHRRKFESTDNDKGEPPSVGGSAYCRNMRFEAIPLKMQQLSSPDLLQQIEAIVYFRKILASDKSPPIDAVMDAGVLPLVVALLDRHDAPQLQMEAAWAVTNMACGTVHQVERLLQSDVVRRLAVLLSSPSDAVREQSLWALGNITIDAAHARCVLEHRVLDPLLFLIGIPAAPSTHHLPSLSTMRHVTWTSVNILRSQPSLETIHRLLFALSQLLESPDEEISLEICRGLLSVCPDHVTLLLELGIASKMKELSDSSSAPLREASLVLMCGMLQSQSLLEKKTLLLQRYNLLKLIPHSISDCEDGKVVFSLYCGALAALDCSSEPIAELVSADFIRLMRRDYPAAQFELGVLIGRCVCMLTTRWPASLSLSAADEALSLLRDLMQSYDAQLLGLAIQSVSALAGRARSGGLVLEDLGPVVEEIKERLGALVQHPDQQLARLAMAAEDSLIY